MQPSASSQTGMSFEMRQNPSKDKGWIKMSIMAGEKILWWTKQAKKKLTYWNEADDTIKPAGWCWELALIQTGLVQLLGQ